MPKPLWDMSLDEAQTSPLFLVNITHQQRSSSSFWCEMINQEPLISGCNRDLQKTEAYLWGYTTCRWLWLKCGMCSAMRHSILASSKDHPAAVVRVSEGMLFWKTTPRGLQLIPFAEVNYHLFFFNQSLVGSWNSIFTTDIWLHIWSLDRKHHWNAYACWGVKA